MQIVRDLAGYSMGRSDLVRRAMSKKKHEVMEKERKNFIYGIVNSDGNVEVCGCVRNGISEKAANSIYDTMIDFASYAFNKSHAAAYAVIAFQTAYLMRYYPSEFIAAMLNSVSGNNEKIAYYTRFAKEEGIELLSPNINESYSKFTVQGNKIRFGLFAIKNVGVNVVNSIVNSRELKGKFKGFEDFCSNIDIGCVNKRAIEGLIKVGAFDCFSVYRSKLLAVYEKVINSVNAIKKKNIEGQINLFEGLEENKFLIQYPDIKEFDKKYILSMEKEMTGIYLSGHPLDEYKDLIKNKISIKISKIISEETLEEQMMNQKLDIKDGSKVIIGGIITRVNKKLTKNNDMMAFVHLEDLYGNIEVIVFPKIFNKCRELIIEDSMIVVQGRINIREGEQPKVICNNIEPLVKSVVNEIKVNEKVYIRIDEEKNIEYNLNKIKNIYNEIKGNIPIYIYINDMKKTFLTNKNLWIKVDRDTLLRLKQLFGDENIKVV